MVTTPVANKVKVFSLSHFYYFMNKNKKKISNKSLIYDNKIMKGGVYYSSKYEHLAVAIAKEYINQGIWAFLVVDEKDCSSRIWHQIGCILIDRNDKRRI